MSKPHPDTGLAFCDGTGDPNCLYTARVVDPFGVPLLPESTEERDARKQPQFERRTRKKWSKVYNDPHMLEEVQHLDTRARALFTLLYGIAYEDGSLGELQGETPVKLLNRRLRARSNQDRGFVRAGVNTLLEARLLSVADGVLYLTTYEMDQARYSERKGARHLRKRPSANKLEAAE